MSRRWIVVLMLCSVVITGCSKKQGEVDEPGEKTEQTEQAPSAVQTPPPLPEDMGDQEQARKYIQEQMAQMEARTAVMDAKAAYALALPEAQKWDAQAKLYQLKGEKKLSPDGSAAMWTGYFAVRTDSRDTPRAEQGKKCTVLMTDGRVMKVKARESAEDIKFSAPCHAFLPAEWLNSKETLALCLAALREKQGGVMNGVEFKRLICSIENINGGTPVWTLSAGVGGANASVEIHAVTGEVLSGQ